jgi:hypothetical protein
MNVEALCRRVTEFGFTLLAADFAIDARQHKVERLSRTRKSLRWVRDDDAALITESQIGDYLSLLERQDYSYLMYDGGVVQVGLTFERNQIDTHRLNFYPCPFTIDRTELAVFGGGLLDYITDAP